MKKKILIFVIALGSFLLTTCSHNEKKDVAEKIQDAQDEVTENTDKVASDVKGDFNQVSDDIKQERLEMSAKIEEIRKKISEDIHKMDAKMSNATAEEKARWKVRKAKMQVKVNDLGNSIDELKSNTNRNWKKFKTDLNKKVDHVQDDLN